MRSLPFAFALALVAIAACSDETSPATSSPADGGTSPDGSSAAKDSGNVDLPEQDAGTDASEPPLTTQNEKEPNNGATTSEVGTMTLPGVMNGAIDPANDVDIFSIAPAPGEFWEWTLAPKGADFAPHLTIFDTDSSNTTNPNVLAKGDAAQTITLQHFVLGTGKLVAVVRDARNVPTATGKGGATYGYALTAKKKTPAPVAVTVPATKTGKLASLSSVDLYAFTLASSTALDVIIRADRKAVPSTLDSRLSLFNVTTKKSAGTNDDATAGTTDSQLGGTLPAGSYIAVVENEGTNAADLSYEIELALR